MKHKFLILLLMVIGIIGAQAQTKMILHQKSGGDVEIAFSEKPVATFEGEEMVISTTETTYRFAISNLVTTSYDENGTTTAIIESVTQLSPDAGPSRIYDLDGHLVKTIPASEPVTVGSLPQGIYIIKNNNSSYKINRK